MPNSCCAFGCSNNSAKKMCREKNISFHLFPHGKPSLMKEWLIKIKRDKFKPTSTTRICSEHFEDDCFRFENFTNRRLLKSTAIPTKFAFNEGLIKPKRKRTSYNIENIFECRDENTQPEDVSFEGETSTCSNNSIKQCHRSTQTISLQNIIDQLAEQKEEIKSLSILLKEGKFTPANIKKDSEMKCLTSFTCENFFHIFNFLSFEDDNSVLSPIDQFFLFMVKIRTGISNEFLAILFKVSSSTVSRIFNKITEIIYIKIKKLNIWPNKTQIKEYMPIEFIKMYPDCRVIVDTTELYIQKPLKLSEQQLTFSFYKNANTLKALIGIAPSGAISFISDLWCGSISDKAIFIESGILNLLESGDVVLADRGFTIAKELEKKKLQIDNATLLKK